MDLSGVLGREGSPEEPGVGAKGVPELIDVGLVLISSSIS